MENKIPWERAFEIREPQDVESRQSVTPAPYPKILKNPTCLTWIVNFLLFLSIIMAVVAIRANYLEIDFLGKVREGLYEPGPVIKTGAPVNYDRYIIFRLTINPVYLIALVFFLIWVHRANFNARGLGNVRMEYTPGWAVGWYFIPIMSLWKPYYVMKEIYQVSKNPQHWLTQEDVHPLVGLWWFFWIISWVLGGAVRMSRRAETFDEIIHAGKISIAANIADILSIITCMVLVSAVHKMQLARAGLTDPPASEFGIESLTVREA
ncbi:MAG: DUF4328 domain-containing protein [Planctomycetota bacterium]|jgi:hypothetical protein